MLLSPVPLLRPLRILLALAAVGSAQQDFYLRPNDTVVFYGDSITDQRLYTTFVETFAVTRFPQLPVRFVHSGWGGDRVSGGAGGTIDERLQRDVLPYKPTIMTIMLGMNDGRYRPFDPEIFETYRSGYVHILDAVKMALPGIRITLIQPSPYDDVTRAPTVPGGYNATLVRYAQLVKDLAGQNGMTVADLNTPMVEMLRKARAADSGMAAKILPDRVHPGAAGHLIMAGLLLKAWGAAPIVTSVEIDAGNGQVKQAVHTEVTGIAGDGPLTWTQKDRVLPMYVNWSDAVTALAVKSSSFLEDLDQQMLKVTGLKSASYALRINGDVVGTFPAEQLASGVNLAAYMTPMMKQAEGVHALTIKRAGVHNARWRNVQVVFEKDNIPRVAAVLDNLDALDADLLAMQRAAAQPAACFYELIPQ